MSEDWQCDKSLAECNKYMLDHEIKTDVTFIIPNKDSKDNTGRESVCYKAHKYMLVSRSPVFYAMLCGVMAEQGDIQVEDTKPEDFKDLLSFIYTDNIELHPTNIFDIIYLSKKYMIPRLTRKCIEYLHSILTPDNACLILDQDLLCEDETLMKESLRMIQICTKKALESETMVDIRRETLMKILNCNILLTPESDVFNACVRWATHQLQLKQVEATGENIRNVLGDCIHQIQYANMGNEDFASLVVPAEILHTEEELAIFRYIGNKELHQPPPNFLCTKRIRAFPLEIMVSDEIETEGIADMDVEVTITSDTNIEIKSLFVGCCKGKTNIDYINFNKNTLNVTGMVVVDGKKQEWKLGSPITLQKDQQNSLKFIFYNSEYDDKEPVYVIKTSEIVADDSIVEIELQSSVSFLPLLGFRYTLVFPE